MMEAIHSSETLVLTRATRRNSPGDGILQSLSRENLKSYTVLEISHRGKIRLLGKITALRDRVRITGQINGLTDYQR
jgi:hypothetical protein